MMKSTKSISQSNGRKKVVFSLIMAFCAIILCFIVPETAIRLMLLLPHNSPTYHNDPIIGYRMNAGLEIRGDRTNAGGFNDYDHDRIKKPGIRRIAMLGDSYVFANVNRKLNFVYLIQSCADSAKHPLELFNMGILASSPSDYLKVLKKDASEIDADMIGVMIFVGNDIIADHPDFHTRITFGSPRVMPRSIFKFGLNSDYFLFPRMVRISFRTLYDKLIKHKGTFSEKTFLAIQKQRSVIFRKNMPLYYRECYDEVIRIVIEMRNYCKENGMDFFVVIAADQTQTDMHVRKELEKRYGITESGYDFGLPQKILSSAFTESDIPFLDLLPYFEEVSKKDTAALFDLQDSHWNEAGNLIAADAMWTYLQNRLKPERGGRH